MRFLKEKAQGLWGGRGAASLLFFQVVASGFQDVSWDNGLGRGLGCSRYRRGGLTTGHCVWSQMSIVQDGREF